MIYSLCSSSFCQGRKGVVVVEKDTKKIFFVVVCEISCCQVFCKVLYTQKILCIFDIFFRKKEYPLNLQKFCGPTFPLPTFLILIDTIPSLFLRHYHSILLPFWLSRVQTVLFPWQQQPDSLSLPRRGRNQSYSRETSRSTKKMSSFSLTYSGPVPWQQP